MSVKNLIPRAFHPIKHTWIDYATVNYGICTAITTGSAIKKLDDNNKIEIGDTGLMQGRWFQGKSLRFFKEPINDEKGFFQATSWKEFFENYKTPETDSGNYLNLYKKDKHLFLFLDIVGYTMPEKIGGKDTFYILSLVNNLAYTDNAELYAIQKDNFEKEYTFFDFDKNKDGFNTIFYNII